MVAIPSDGFEGSLICCAYVPAAGAEVSVAGLRASLATLLPGYMLPARWMRYESLPKNANGKIDRPRLSSAFAGDASSPAWSQLAAPQPRLKAGGACPT